MGPPDPPPRGVVAEIFEKAFFFLVAEFFFGSGPPTPLVATQILPEILRRDGGYTTHMVSGIWGELQKIYWNPISLHVETICFLRLLPPAPFFILRPSYESSQLQ